MAQCFFRGSRANRGPLFDARRQTASLMLSAPQAGRGHHAGASRTPRHGSSQDAEDEVSGWGMPVEIRPADAADGLFLAEMLVAAAFWRPEGPQGKVSDVMDQPELAHYVVGWPQPGDCGVIAEDEHPVGAAWFRFLPASDPGFGFVDAKTPEVGMGVALSRRGQGIGSRLLSSLVAQARSDGLATLSLSVERDNYARGLYERVGFRAVGSAGGSLTMLLRL